jgi:hypothetical protein
VSRKVIVALDFGTEREADALVRALGDVFSRIKEEFENAG